MTDYLNPEVYPFYKTSTTITASWVDSAKEWKIEHVINQSRKKVVTDEWEKKEVAISVTARTLEKAIAESSVSLIAYMEQVGGDLFQDVNHADNLLN